MRNSNYNKILLNSGMDFSVFESEGWPWWSSPFNGQSRRLSNFFVIGAYLRPKFAIETGTFVGTSTHLFSGLGVEKTFSIEIVEKYALIARNRLKKLIDQGRIEIILGSSVDHIAQILEGISKDQPVIAYLDAHWHDYLPTTQELIALIQWGGPFVAVIDDFQIPDFPGYGFDSYAGNSVGPETIPVHADISLWMPSESQEYETGALRGTGYVFSKSALELIPPEVLNDLKLREHKL